MKRYPDKEKREDEAAVKILEDDVKVYNEADSATAEVAKLPKDLVVVRLASLEKEGFTLVDFPSGIGQFSPGWVETKFLEAKGEKVARDQVLEGRDPLDDQAVDAGRRRGQAASDRGQERYERQGGRGQDHDADASAPDLNELGKKATELAKDAGIVLPPPPAPPKQK